TNFTGLLAESLQLKYSPSSSGNAWNAPCPRACSTKLSCTKPKITLPATEANYENCTCRTSCLTNCTTLSGGRTGSTDRSGSGLTTTRASGDALCQRPLFC